MKKTPTEVAYSELQIAYNFINEQLFNKTLPNCLITFQRNKNTFGYFNEKRYINKENKTTDEIALNPEYFLCYPLIEIFQTLAHEMCHQWQNHYGKPSRRCYHNREWANKMIEIGLMPSHTGLPGGKKTGQKMADYPTPNGKFINCIMQLLKTGFRISWFDRFPVKREPKIVLEWQKELMNELSDEEKEIFEKITQKPEIEGAIFQDDNTNSLSGKKFKYSCPSCHCSVWGKNNINIICCDCKQQYEKLG